MTIKKYAVNLSNYVLGRELNNMEIYIIIYIAYANKRCYGQLLRAKALSKELL